MLSSPPAYVASLCELRRARNTKKPATLPKTQVITNKSAKIPMFIPWVIRESDCPKHAAQANSLEWLREAIRVNNAGFKNAFRALIDN